MVNLIGRSDNMIKCLFCEIVSGEIPCEKIYEDDLVIAFMDVEPINDGHVLVIPKAHKLDLDDLSEEEANRVMSVSRKVLKGIKKVYKCNGYSVMQNGGEFNDVGHYHMHIYPRYKDDGFGWIYGDFQVKDIHEEGKKLRENLEKGTIEIKEYEENYLMDLWKIFYETVHTINIKDYSESQVNVWAPKDRDVETWGEKFLKTKCYVAKLDEKIVGFGNLDENKVLDRLFVHKDYQGKGVASLLVEKLLQEAKKMGYSEIYTEASITARPFFMAKGFHVVKKQNKEHNGEFFINYVMKKDL